MPDSRSRLDVSNIPSKYSVASNEPAGKALFEYAAETTNAMDRHLHPAENGRLAGRRVLRAVFHLRSADVGRQMLDAATDAADDRHADIHRAIAESGQYLVEGGVTLTVTAALSALDLCAAALDRLHGARGTSGREAKIYSVPAEDKGQLPGDVQAWLDDVRNDAEYVALRDHRNDVVHGDFHKVETLLFKQQLPRLGGAGGDKAVSSGSGSGSAYQPYRIDHRGRSVAVDEVADEALRVGTTHCVALINVLHARYGP